MSEFEWWKGGPVASSAVLTVEALQEAFMRVREEGYTSPMFYLDPKAAHYYRCVLARAYWKREYREWRMFRTACERGWLNARV
jgi:hypothetical protein